MIVWFLLMITTVYFELIYSTLMSLHRELTQESFRLLQCIWHGKEAHQTIFEFQRAAMKLDYL